MYSGKLLSEKTIANFEVLWLFVQVLYTKFGGVASFGGSSKQKFSPQKSFSTNSRKFFSLESFQLYGILRFLSLPARLVILMNTYTTSPSLPPILPHSQCVLHS